MNLKILFLSALSMSVAANAQAVNLRGKITSASGKVLAGATVALSQAKKTATSGADGTYSMSIVGVLQPLSKGESGAIALERGTLVFSVAVPAPLRVEIFDVKGNLLDRQALDKSSGTYRLDLAGRVPAGNLLIVKASLGKDVKTFQYVQTSDDNRSSAIRLSAITLEKSAPSGARLTKVAATIDTMKVSAAGYTSKSVLISSYDAEVNVTLDSAADRWGGLKNPPIKSAGCGKALGVIPKSGTYHISSSGGRGDYIIDIPTGYDKDTPYRLIFGNHCLGASAARVAEAEKGTAGDDLSGYYSIKTMATKDNIQAIHVAMQGDAGGTWSLPNDSKFWNDVLTLVENNLCVDTTRVFVNGFSFGAMFSYVLSLEYPEKIRAVATYAPANYNMTQPTNRHIPIAYYQVTGTTDGTCPWVNNEAQKRGGKFCLLQHMQDNGCTSTAADIKLATSSTHVSTEFTGCKEGYPVKFGSFQGGHQAVHTDPGTNFNWIEKEAWEFFKRF
jgi:poly(3-hydroxybutyrate) depolymerase